MTQEQQDLIDEILDILKCDQETMKANGRSDYVRGLSRARMLIEELKEKKEDPNGP